MVERKEVTQSPEIPIELFWGWRLTQGHGAAYFGTSRAGISAPPGTPRSPKGWELAPGLLWGGHCCPQRGAAGGRWGQGNQPERHISPSPSPSHFSDREVCVGRCPVLSGVGLTQELGVCQGGWAGGFAVPKRLRCLR